MLARLHRLLLLFSAASFLGYGLGCFLLPYMRREFRRYGLTETERRLVGALQLAGACGLLVGLEVPWIGRAAAAGLALLMFLGVRVRLKIHDTFLQTFPAFFYMVLNAYLCVAAF